MNELPLRSAWQVEVARERIARLSIALTIVAVPVRPTGIITPIPTMVIGLPVVSWTATEYPRIVVLSIARPEVGLPPVVIAIRRV
ncbi:MAG TPA: hypothetical protein VFV95_02535 [Vicinamibacterales bacterium]|nr:hypothetical protein [Vicinamibacterales bacterium]